MADPLCIRSVGIKAKADGKNGSLFLSMYENTRTHSMRFYISGLLSDVDNEKVLIAIWFEFLIGLVCECVWAYEYNAAYAQCSLLRVTGYGLRLLATSNTFRLSPR